MGSAQSLSPQNKCVVSPPIQQCAVLSKAGARARRLLRMWCRGKLLKALL